MFSLGNLQHIISLKPQDRQWVSFKILEIMRGVSARGGNCALQVESSMPKYLNFRVTGRNFGKCQNKY
jgi:hypothetical protein